MQMSWHKKAVTQQPVTVGQYCTCGDVTGTVEDINLGTIAVLEKAGARIAEPPR